MIFFLDIDGVMVHAIPYRKVELAEDGFYVFNSVAVEILKSVISIPHDELILSTSHRFKFSIPEWRQIFEARGLSVKNISIVDLPLELKSNRLSEIIDWITQKHLDPNEIIIIDDDKSLNDLPSHLKERLILTDSYAGLNYAAGLHKLINRPLIE